MREAVGDRLEIMVDANQGWRMPGDRAPRWDVATAIQCARGSSGSASTGSRSRSEPTTTTGYAALAPRRRSGSRPGEMVRDAAEARDLVVRGLVDVVQADVVFVGGLGGCRRIAALCDLHGRTWSPHTWSNGLGLVANLHGALALLDVPVRRGAVRPAGVDARAPRLAAPGPARDRADGTIAPPAGPGLGVDLDLDALEQWRVA